MKTATVNVYLKGGTIIEYQIQAKSEVLLAAKTREHGQAIMSTGIRFPDTEGNFEWYGPHWIDKIKTSGVKVPSKYPITIKGT